MMAKSITIRAYIKFKFTLFKTMIFIFTIKTLDTTKHTQSIVALNDNIPSLFYCIPIDNLT